MEMQLYLPQITSVAGLSGNCGISFSQDTAQKAAAARNKGINFIPFINLFTHIQVFPKRAANLQKKCFRRKNITFAAMKRSFADILTQLDGDRAQKVARKLPAWASAGIEIPSALSLEQCSSSATASYKAGLAAAAIGISDPDGQCRGQTRGHPWPRKWEGPAPQGVGGMSEAKVCRGSRLSGKGGFIRSCRRRRTLLQGERRRDLDPGSRPRRQLAGDLLRPALVQTGQDVRKTPFHRCKSNTFYEFSYLYNQNQNR